MGLKLFIQGHISKISPAQKVRRWEVEGARGEEERKKSPQAETSTSNLNIKHDELKGGTIEQHSTFKHAQNMCSDPHPFLLNGVNRLVTTLKNRLC